MTTALKIALRSDGQLELDGRLLDARRWQLAGPSDTGTALTPRAAFETLGAAGLLRHIVVGIIGPRDAPPRRWLLRNRSRTRLAGWV